MYLSNQNNYSMASKATARSFPNAWSNTEIHKVQPPLQISLRRLVSEMASQQLILEKSLLIMKHSQFQRTKYSELAVMEELMYHHHSEQSKLLLQPYIKKINSVFPDNIQVILPLQKTVQLKLMPLPQQHVLMVVDISIIVWIIRNVVVAQMQKLQKMEQVFMTTHTAIIFTSQASPVIAVHKLSLLKAFNLQISK